MTNQQFWLGRTFAWSTPVGSMRGVCVAAHDSGILLLRLDSGAHVPALNADVWLVKDAPRAPDVADQGTRIVFTSVDGRGYDAPPGWEITGGFAAGPSQHVGANPLVGVILRKVPT